MDVQRFLDLYISEAHEHVRLLQRSLLGMEAQPTGPSVDEAFRAAHTLKGLSAAMGYDAVADLAHLLEDRLAEIRAGRISAAPALIDDMLKQADGVEAAIATAVAVPHGGDPTAPVAPTPGSAPAPAAAVASAEPRAPAGTAVARVRLRADTPLKPVRAMLIMRALEGIAGVIGSEPAEFGEQFAGEFRVLFGPNADVAAARVAILGAGEVEAVELLDPAAAQAQAGAAQSGVAAAAQPAGAAAGAAAGARQLRVDADRLDSLGDGIGELALLLARLDPGLALPAPVADVMDRMAAAIDQLQYDVLKLRMVPVRQAFERLPRVVRDAARSLGREVELVVSGDDVELDRTILDEIGDPLVHLLRNAVGHGIEPAAERLAAGKPGRGRIEVRAERERTSVRIVVSDDGRGVQADRVVERARADGLDVQDPSRVPDDEELLRLLSRPGLSTADEVSGLSGRGVGMDVVVSRIRALGGAIDMRTETGAGTTFTMRLPISLALTQVLRVRVAGEDYAIPLTHISEALELHEDEPVSVQLRGEAVPLVRLGPLLGAHGHTREQAAVIAGSGSRRAALAVDELVGREQILVKTFDAAAGMLPYFSGATLLADGRPALVLDPLSMIPD